MNFQPLNEYLKEKSEEAKGSFKRGARVDFEVRDLRNGDWFWIHKKVIENYAEKIGSIGLAVYQVLCYFANDKTQRAFPSYENLAKKSGSSKMSVRRIIKKLEECQLIKIEKEKGKVNIYKLLKIK